MTTVLLLGSTGGTGKNILRLLVENTQYSIKLLVRDIERAKKVLTSDYSAISSEDLKKIELYEGSITDPNLPTDLFDVDFILHTAASHGIRPAITEEQIGFGGMKNIIKHAKQSKKLKKIVYVTSGFVTRPWHFVALILNSLCSGALKWKLAAENALRESGIPYVICRPSGQLVNRTIEGGVDFGVGDKISNTISRVSVAETVLKCVELDKKNITFEVINNPKKPKIDWDELTSLPSDSFTTIHRNHDMPFYTFYTIGLIAIGFIVKKYFF